MEKFHLRLCELGFTENSYIYYSDNYLNLNKCLENLIEESILCLRLPTIN